LNAHAVSSGNGSCRRLAVLRARLGSGPLSVIGLALRLSCRVEDAFAEEVEFRAAVHLSFEHFDAVDVAFDVWGP
jgi:hypothetical protein